MKKHTNDKFEFLKGKLLSGRVYPEFFLLDPNDRVINLGCGEGPQAIIYAGQYQEMLGVDINKERLERSKEAMKIYGISNYKTLLANVENTPLPNNSFDKAIAMDIIEHVQSPQGACLEANRLLTKGGELLITFPAMYDHYRSFASWVGRAFLKKRKKESSPQWNPDVHNQSHSLKQWIAIVESCGFKLVKSRATTLFPPLHLVGVPRFWFSNNVIHKIDAFFCKMPCLKNLGQTLLCVFKKNGNRELK